MKHSVHQKLDVARDLAEFSDDQFIANKIVVIQNVLFEILHVRFVIIICVIADDDY